jgi:hypothetical protein
MMLVRTSHDVAMKQVDNSFLAVPSIAMHRRIASDWEALAAASASFCSLTVPGHINCLGDAGLSAIHCRSWGLASDASLALLTIDAGRQAWQSEAVVPPKNKT